MNIYIGADHRGFALKEQITAMLEHSDQRVTDCGADMYIPDDDYPDYARAVAERVAADPDGRGILICGSGAGICIAANKVRGIRAALGFDVEQVRAAVSDDHANILCLAADYGNDDRALGMADTFLATTWSDEVRHMRRVAKIED